MTDSPLIAAGRTVPDAIDRVRRYCGLTWTGGGSETWAWPYYDAVVTAHDNVVSAGDVLASAALHPGLSRADLTFFRERSSAISGWLDPLDPALSLRAADDQTLKHIASLVDFDADVSITLISKVLHRKRPRLIPLLDRHIIDWYRPVTGERSPRRAWGPFLDALRLDVAEPVQHRALSVARALLNAELAPGTSADDECRGLSDLRMIDIAVWMGSR